MWGNVVEFNNQGPHFIRLSYNKHAQGLVYRQYNIILRENQKNPYFN
jgi:hypothetical protein